MDEEVVDELELGGNIQLSGFGEIEKTELIVVKKMVGSSARKFADHFSDFEKLHLTLKIVHKREKSEKYEIMGKLVIGGKAHNAEDTDRNIYFCLDRVLKKLETEVTKDKN
ncbi:MAG: hypothetical protein V1743_02055 [Nanoarchaeota archaeon]